MSVVYEVNPVVDNDIAEQFRGTCRCVALGVSRECAAAEDAWLAALAQSGWSATSRIFSRCPASCRPRCSLSYCAVSLLATARVRHEANLAEALRANERANERLSVLVRVQGASRSNTACGTKPRWTSTLRSMQPVCAAMR